MDPSFIRCRRNPNPFGGIGSSLGVRWIDAIGGCTIALLGSMVCVWVKMLVLSRGKELGGLRYSHRKLRAGSICWCNVRDKTFEILVIYLFIKLCALLGSAKWAWPRPNDSKTII